MKVKNEILEEVWKIKDEMGKKYSFDVEKIGRTLKEKQKARNGRLVNLHQQKKDAA